MPCNQSGATRTRVSATLESNSWLERRKFLLENSTWAVRHENMQGKLSLYAEVVNCQLFGLCLKIVVNFELYSRPAVTFEFDARPAGSFEFDARPARIFSHWCTPNFLLPLKWEGCKIPLMKISNICIYIYRYRYSLERGCGRYRVGKDFHRPVLRI
jgi:hypothetical protein